MVTALIIIAALLFCLCWKMKLYDKGEWNTEVLSLSSMKTVQGFCAICIMLHHISQKTCAPWLPIKYQVHGLDIFVSIGYLCVSVFFFCSGYGLYKSYKEKEEYLVGFFKRRAVPILLTFFLVEIVFMVVSGMMQAGVQLRLLPFTLGGMSFANQYAWYVPTILLFYLFFYLSFRVFKEERYSLISMVVLVLIYICFCDWWMYGSWWINSSLAFLVGIFFCKYENTIVPKIKKRYILCLLLCLFGTLASHWISENLDLFMPIDELQYYTTARLTKLLLQMLASVFVAPGVVLIGMKVKIGNRILSFMGTITLEFYLIHGLFVQLFGYCYNYEPIPPLCYIKNPLLLTIIVVVLAVPGAVAIKFLVTTIIGAFSRKERLLAHFWRKIKILAVFAILILFITVIVSSVQNRKRSRLAQEPMNEYVKENITFVNVDGKKMATYTLGEGEHTIVLLSGEGDPCPTLTLKPMAKQLATKNKVVILDYFGKGFSDDTENPRTVDNFVSEIHEALMKLEIEKPILMSASMSGAYALAYCQAYPDEVEAVIGVDVSVTKQIEEKQRVEGISRGDYLRMNDKAATLNFCLQRMANATGLVQFQLPLYEGMFNDSLTETEKDVLKELFTLRYYNQNSIDEIRREPDNLLEVKNLKFDSELPVLLMLDYTRSDSSRYDYLYWKENYEELLMNKDKQKMVVVNGSPYMIYYNCKALATVIDEFMEDNLLHK